MAVNFSCAHVGSIESALEQHRPGAWRRLGIAELEQHSDLPATAGWHLKVREGQFACAGVNRIHLVIDNAFPTSEPRVIVPSLKLGEWPHVEAGGLLCLIRTARSASAGDRAMGCISYARDLLNFDDARRKQEFAREFAAYWAHNISVSSSAPLFMTLTAPLAGSREIYFARYRKGARVILGENRESLQRWLEHSGENVERGEIRKTLQIWLPEPWAPAEFPTRVQDVVNRVDRAALNPLLRAGESLPVLFGAVTESGPVFVGIDVPGGSPQQFKNGFRRNHVPGVAVAMLTGGHAVHRCRVERADAGWVHGRDHNEQQSTLGAKCIGVIGCGSLGASVTRLLAQMGVGRFILIDSDALTAANTSRHVLGSSFVRENKAAATRRMLVRDFPHLTGVESFESRFQKLADTQFRRLAECDVIVSAGVDTAGDSVLDQWRRALERPPVHVCTWVEEYALVGHAVALFAGDSLFSGFNADGIPAFSMTHWPQAAQTLIVEAGCGNSFQPHGVIDLSNSVSLAAKLVLDVLTGDVTGSCRRSWLGDRKELARLGGTPLAEFDMSNTIKEFAWKNGAP